MNEKSTKLLRDAAPILFRNLHGDAMVTCMAWGFECGEGWLKLLLNGSTKIEWLIQQMQDQGTPYEELPVAAQVKEKFGTLRFYVDNETPEISEIVSDMEQASGRTCEVCGCEGTTRGGGWVTTLCDTCENVRQAKRKSANGK